jgi:hypothetical protein
MDALYIDKKINFPINQNIKEKFMSAAMMTTLLCCEAQLSIVQKTAILMARCILFFNRMKKVVPALKK